jgi:ligand-binding sensor domain-containing protein
LKIKLLHIFLLSLFHIMAQAQTAFFNSIPVDEADETMPVNSLFKDSRGYIWIGARGGLYMYNGKTSRNMLPDSLKNRLVITAIEEDTNNRIWFGCQSGYMGFIENNILLPFSPEEGLPKKPITDILFDKTGRLWFSTADEGVYILEQKILYNINTDDGLPDNYVNTLQSDQLENIIAGTDRGIAILNIKKGQKKISSFSSRNGLPDNIVRSIRPSGNFGKYWVGMEDKGLCIFDSRLGKIIVPKGMQPWSFGRINDMLCLEKDIWIATEDSGLIHLSMEKDSTFKHPALMYKPGKITALVNDNEGQIWVTQPGRIVRTTAPLIRFLKHTDAGMPTPIHVLSMADDGSAWIADEEKIHHLRGNMDSWETISSYSLPVASMQDITTIYEDPYGQLWIGTIGAGIILLDPVTARWKKLTGNPVIENGHILAITGRDSSIWVTGLNGIANYTIRKIKDGQPEWDYTNYNKQSGIGSDYVYQVYIDKRNRVWFATDGAGVSCKEGEKITNFNGQAGLTSTVIYGITEDNAGNIYLNTLDGGIVKYDGKKFIPFYNTTGKQNGTVTSIMTNASNQLVVMHKKGLDIVALSNGRSMHYGKSNGITQEQVNLNIIGKNTDGSIWIGTNDGIICLLPEQIHPASTPKTAITGLSVFGNSIAIKDQMVFSHADNNITIYFDGIYFTEPDQVLFQYQLTGYHKEWITSSDRQVNFPRLLPGKYTLMVRSSTNGRFDLSDQAAIQFTITPPFWKTWWFIILASAASILLLYAIMSQRVMQLQKWERLKQEKINAELQTLRAQVNPHFLFNSFNTLMGVIEENPEKALEYTEQLSAFYRNMLTYRETDLISLSEEAKLLQTYIYLQQQRFGIALHYNFNVSDQDLNHYQIPPLTLQLLAENAIKHNTVSVSTPLNLQIFKEGEFLIISNSINHKRKRETGEGMGLKNIMHRYALFSDKPVIIEADEKMFSVRLPLIKNKHHAHPDR